MSNSSGIKLPYRFEPREYQYPFLRYFDETPARQRAFLLAHRRTGKDLLAWNNLIKESQKRVGTYWHVLPLLNQARKIIWTGSTRDGIPFLDFIPPPLIKSKRDDDMSIRLTNGSLIQLVGADRIDSLMGSNPIGINLSEFALMKPSVWDYLSPILNENDGWATFITTPRGRNHAFELFRSMVQAMKNGAPYFVQVLTVDDTRKTLTDVKGNPILDKQGKKIMVPVMPPEAIQEQRDLNIPEEIIQQEYYCFKPDTLITTDRGQVPIIDVREGDKVLTHTNRLRKVTRCISHYHDGDMIRIKSYGNGKDLVCTPNHPIRIYDKGTQTYSWKQAQNIQKGDRITYPKRSTGTPIVSEEFAKLVAWFIAEGSCSKNAVQFTLHSAEKEYHAEIIRIAEACGYKAHLRIMSDSQTAQIYIYDTDLQDTLVSLCGSGAKNKHIPFEVIKGHDKVVWETLIKGDGCEIQDKYTWWSYCTVSETLAYDMQQLSIMLGLRAGITKQAESSVIQGRQVNSTSRYNVQIRQCNKSKYDAKNNDIAKYCMHSAVREVTTEYYKGTVYNLSVQYDESYVAEGRVVHNCSFEAGLVGAYYAQAMRKLEAEHKTDPRPDLFDPDQPVYTAWDLGISDSMAIWYFQFIKGDINVIEYNEFAERSLAECCCLVRADFKKLKEDFGWEDADLERAAHQFSHHLKYKYKDHFGPHDINTRDIAMGVTRKQVAKKYGVKFKAVKKTLVNEGIDLVRRLMLLVTFDGGRCLLGIRALKEYHKEKDEETQLYKDKPCHDWTSHGADAFRYLCQGIVQYIDTQAAKMADLSKEADYKYNPLLYKVKKIDRRDDERRKPGKKKRRVEFAKSEYNPLAF